MKKHFWKKQISILFAGTVLCSMFGAMPASAAEQPSLLILGDSISSGEGLADGEYGYYDYVAECTGSALTNLAQSGTSTEELLNLISDAANQDAIKKADIISISIGGNDLMQPAKDYFATLQKDGETMIQTAKRLAKEGDIVKIMGNLTATLRAPRQAAIANYPVIEEKLRALNPDAKIVMQTLYNPFEVSESYLQGRGSSASDIKNFNTLMTYVNNNEKQLNTAIAALETVKTAEVGEAFKGESLIYDRVLENDPHPTALGHALIAATVLDAIGDVSGKSAKLKKTLDGLDPAVAAQISAGDKKLIEKYVLSDAGEPLRGDVTLDGEISVEDAQKALIAYTEAYAGNPVDLTDAQRKAADVNGDGELSVEDAQFILIYYTENVVAGKTVSWDQIIPKQ